VENDGAMFVFRRNPLRPRLNICKDEKWYKRWCLSHPYCHFCGVPADKAEWPGLSTHHMVKPHRSHESCVLIRACHRDHQLCEGQELQLPHGLQRPLSLGVVLSVKLFRDSDRPEDWNPDRLMAIRGQCLPDLEPIPAFLESEYRFWRPWDGVHFFTDMEDAVAKLAMKNALRG
jgi:hypothetical protein